MPVQLLVATSDTQRHDGQVYPGTRSFAHRHAVTPAPSAEARAAWRVTRGGGVARSPSRRTNAHAMHTALQATLRPCCRVQPCHHGAAGSSSRRALVSWSNADPSSAARRPTRACDPS